MMEMRSTARVLGATLVAAGLMASATAARADVKCRQAVAKASALATQGIAKTMQKCEQLVLDGKLTGSCPDSKAADAIAKSKSKLTAAITKVCTTSTGEFALGRCPNETGLTGSCGNILIKTKDDEGACLGCLAEHNAKELFHAVIYGQAVHAANTTIAKCQKGTGKAVLGFYNAKSKVLQKCHDSVLKGKLPSCPDQKTTDAITKAESKKVASITKACCGADKVCGGTDDVSPLNDFKLPSPCPGITSGASPIVVLDDTGTTMLTCLDTQADQRTDCQDAIGAPFAFGGALPSSCTTSTPECTSSGSTKTVTIAVTSATSLGGVTVSVGYQNAMIPGTGDIGSRGGTLDGSGIIAASDNDDTVLASVVDPGGLPDGDLITIQFDTCSGGPLPTVADFGCVVRSASDTSGVDLIDGVSCSVTSVM
jgi:hypothetical protein